MSTGVVVVGVGYVGLTAGVSFAKAGTPVVLYDIDPQVVGALNAGRPRGSEFLSYLHADIAQLFNKGLMKATHNSADLIGQQNFLIAVPSERKGEAWMEPVIDSIYLALRVAETPPLIIIESTVIPGTAQKIVKSVEQQLGAKVGKDYWLAVAPRKDWFADEDKNLANLPRVVGGVTPECTDKAVALLSTVCKDIHTTDADIAELTKSIENGLFHVNIMYAHQLALSMPDKNIAEAVRLACLHWRLPKLHLGFGSGGRCVPMGSRYLLQSLKQDERLKGSYLSSQFSLASYALLADDTIRTAISGYANTYAHQHSNARVMVMGLGYRQDFADVGLSPGLEIAQRLQKQGVAVVVHDTLYSAEDVKKKFDLTFLPLVELGSCDLILLATPHTAYLDVPLIDVFWHRGQSVLDAQGAWNKYRNVFATKGIHYRQVGDPGWLDVPA